MYNYYDKKSGEFVLQSTRTKSASKIEITAEALDQNKVGTYGPADIDFGYVSLISGIEFYWDDLREALLDPKYDIGVYNPSKSYGTRELYIDR